MLIEDTVIHRGFPRPDYIFSSSALPKQLSYCAAYLRDVCALLCTSITVPLTSIVN